MKLTRRALLELFGITLFGAVIGFLGPFGTFLMGDVLDRFGRWWFLIAGAYVLVRPAMICCRWIARATLLPPGAMTFWGVLAVSVPLAGLWRATAPEAMANLSGYAGLVPFSLLCSLAVMAVAWWAERADAHLSYYYADVREGAPNDRPAPVEELGDRVSAEMLAPAASMPVRPAMYGRLSPAFMGDIIALESEDHYVRVHGTRQSELILMRLRDAIAAMDGCRGEQTHRSWWVARDAVAGTVVHGRRKDLRLTNGLRVPVARDTLDHLQRSGFLEN